MSRRDRAMAVRPVNEWATWYVYLWVILFLGLIVSVWFVDFYVWWTLVVIFFGIPEFIGSVKQDDRYPPLTHVIVRYVNQEISFPILFGLVGTVGAFWIGFANPWRIGLLVGLIGWLSAHFGSRYTRREFPQ